MNEKIIVNGVDVIAHIERHVTLANNAMQRHDGFSREDAKHFMRQSFGAVEAFTLMADEETADRLVKLWDDTYVDKFNRIIYGEG